MKKFMPKEISPHAVVCHLQNEIENIAELYVVIKDKHGDFYEALTGSNQGLAFSIVVLQKHLMDRLDRLDE